MAASLICHPREEKQQFIRLGNASQSRSKLPCEDHGTLCWHEAWLSSSQCKKLDSDSMQAKDTCWFCSYYFDVWSEALCGNGDARNQATPRDWDYDSVQRRDLLQQFKPNRTLASRTSGFAFPEPLTSWICIANIWNNCHLSKLEALLFVILVAT